ncbi:hypothetical protein COO60DRAFT_1015778 [Scenedesmus sp. NREL 46B-D3]|nr:hypothetical protein COO60DRAFT_1015778 [Scenedesmus sp. NREL 46B-D3]
MTPQAKGQNTASCGAAKHACICRVATPLAFTSIWLVWCCCSNAGCQIGTLGAQHLAAGLASVYRPAQATITGSRSQLQQQPAHTPCLRVLQLSGNALGPKGLKQLLAGLAAAQAAAGDSLLTQLQVLELGCNTLGDAGAAALAQCYEHLSSLQLLGLSGNGIGADGARALFGCLTGSSSSSSAAGGSSSACSPARSQPGAAFGSTAAAAAARQQALPALRVLQLGGNFLGDAGAAALAAALPGLQQLRQLELQDNYSIGCEGVRALAAALPLAPSLQELNLAKNCIGPQGAKLLATGLQANAAAAAAAASNAALDSTTKDAASGNCSNIRGGSAFVGLRYLELEWCKLKVEGVAHVAAALVMQRPGLGAAAQQGVGAQCCLQRLGLGRNGAGDKGVNVSWGSCEAVACYAVLNCLVKDSSLVNVADMHGALRCVACWHACIRSSRNTA